MKIAQGGIRYCSSCFGQYLDRDHVDFESVYDGPAIKQENGDYHHIGDLIICSNCLKNAGALIGLYPAEDLKTENEELGKALEDKVDENNGLRKAYLELEKSIDGLEALSKQKITRPAREPRIMESVGIANGT